MRDIDTMNERRLLAGALRHAADYLDHPEWLEENEREPDLPVYAVLEAELMDVVKQLDTTGDLTKASSDLLLAKRSIVLQGGLDEAAEYEEWLKRQIKTAEENLEARRAA